MYWRASLPRPIKLADGRVLETLLDAGNFLVGDTFDGVTQGPPVERALELLLRASETGDATDIRAAANHLATVLRMWRMVA